MKLSFLLPKDTPHNEWQMWVTYISLSLCLLRGTWARGARADTFVFFRVASWATVTRQRVVPNFGEVGQKSKQKTRALKRLGGLETRKGTTVPTFRDQWTTLAGYNYVTRTLGVYWCVVEKWAGVMSRRAFTAPNLVPRVLSFPSLSLSPGMVWRIRKVFILLAEIALAIALQIEKERAKQLLKTWDRGNQEDQIVWRGGRWTSW